MKGLTNYIEVLHDALWWNEYFQGGDGRPTFLEHIWDILKIIQT